MSLMKIKKNPNPEEFDKISQAIEANDGYCCCAIEHTPDVICPCVPFRMRDSSGPCECGRYYKTKNYPILTICGSSRFKDRMEEIARTATREGYMVLMPHLYGHKGDKVDDIKDMLDDLHKAKIEKADLVYVVNPDGYVGESTAAEIEWARYLRKTIVSDEPLKD